MNTRAAQEVQAAMVIAKRFPRDVEAALNRINKACQRRALAEQAEYEYPRGGEKVSGPSIRLAEMLAQNWGNIDFGIIELGQANGESQVMAYCWDLETNTRQTKVFTVPHVRYTKSSGARKLGEDPRDIYEVVANQGARRLRACILGVIPGDVVDEAREACNRTLDASNAGKPLTDRIAAAVKMLEEYGVSASMIETKFGCKTEALSDRQVRQLGRIYNALRDGIGKVEGFFEKPAAPASNPLADAKTGEVAPAEKSAPEKAAEKKTEPPSELPLAPPPQNTEVGPAVKELIELVGADGLDPAHVLAWAIDAGHTPKDTQLLRDIPEDAAREIVKNWEGVGRLLTKRTKGKARS